jgi:hypothetical protein
MRELNKRVLDNLYCFPDSIRVTQLRDLWWVGHISSNKENSELDTKFWSDNIKGSYKKIILKLVSK